jgi:hypothetical protein
MSCIHMKNPSKELLLSYQMAVRFSLLYSARFLMKESRKAKDVKALMQADIEISQVDSLDSGCSSLSTPTVKGKRGKIFPAELVEIMQQVEKVLFSLSLSPSPSLANALVAASNMSCMWRFNAFLSTSCLLALRSFGLLERSFSHSCPGEEAFFDDGLDKLHNLLHSLQNLYL